MASFAPLHTGQFVVRLRPLRQRRSTAVMLLMVTLIAWGCFEAGRSLGGYSVVQSATQRLKLQQRIDELNKETVSLRRELNAVGISRTMDQEAVSSLQRNLEQLQTQLQKQKQELVLYESVLNPTNDAKSGPQVQRVDVQPTGTANQFVMRLVMVRSMNNGGAAAQGELNVEVTGTRDGKPETLPLAALVRQEKVEALRFSYKYFQTLEQNIELPAGFEPQSVNVELHEGAHAAARQTFAWQVAAT